MSLLKKLAGQTAVYGLGSVLGRALNFFFVPLYTSIFAPGEYGILTELYAYIAFLNVLFIYGMETAYFRFCSKEKNQHYFNVAFTSILISSIFLSGLIIFFADSIAQVVDYPDKSHFIHWLAFILAIDAIVAIPFAKLRQEGKTIRFVSFKLSVLALNIGFNLFFLVFCPWFLNIYPAHVISKIYVPELGVGYVLLSNLLSNTCYLFFFIPMWLEVKLLFDKSVWKKMIRYACPVLLTGFAGVTNEMLSRAILKYRLPEGFYIGISNLEILGIFGACYKFSVFMTLVVQAFRYAYEPFFFSKAKDKNSPRLFSKVMTYFVIFTSFGWLVISIFLPHFASIFLRQESYLRALDSIPWLLGGGLFLGIFYNLSIWYKLTDKTLYGACISITGALCTLILNWLLIPVLGYMGSAIATFASYLFMVIISFIWGSKHYVIPYQTLKIVAYVALAGLGIILNSQFQPSLLTPIIITLMFLTLPFILEKKRKKI